MDSNPPTQTQTQTQTQTPTPTPATDTETPPLTQPFKSLSFSNGSLKPHNHRSTVPVPPAAAAPVPVMVVCSYKECLKNHAATMGGLALDGCGEFLPSPSATHSDPTSLKCGACGCHRNFHRRGTEDPTPKVLSIHRLSSPSPNPSPNTVCSPPPLSHLPPSQYYYSSVPPQMLMSISTASPPQPPNDHWLESHPPVTRAENPLGRKRFRTKFTQEQKQKMFMFCERLDWKMPKSNEMLMEFCNEVGVNRRVLKVWMHNNKNPLRKKEIGFGHNVNDDNGNGGRVSFEKNAYSCKKEIDNNEDVSPNLHVSANESSS